MACQRRNPKKYLKYKEKPAWHEGYIVLKDSTRIDGLVREYNMNTQKLYSPSLICQQSWRKETVLSALFILNMGTEET
jgi:hypothetical protein